MIRSPIPSCSMACPTRHSSDRPCRSPVRVRGAFTSRATTYRDEARLWGPSSMRRWSASRPHPTATATGKGRPTVAFRVRLDRLRRLRGWDQAQLAGGRPRRLVAFSTQRFLVLRALELGRYGAPPAGLEPAPPAPEAGALSAELRGRELLKQGTIVLARGGHHPRPPGTGECCRILHLHADGPHCRHRAAGAPPPPALGVGGRKRPPACGRHRPARAGGAVRHPALRLRRGASAPGLP